MNIHAQEIKDPCAGASAMLSLINRPTFSDSACVVKFGDGLAEMGYAYYKIISGGHGYDLPQTQLRLGLPLDNEISIYLEDHIRQTDYPHSGSNAAFITAKHEIGYTEKWLGAIEAIATLPNGSAVFGNKYYGATLNGIVTYSFNDQFSLLMSLAINRLADPSSLGGKRFTSISPDVVLSWLPNSSVDIYVEVYGTTRTGAHTGSGNNADAGVIYLLRQNVTLDVEFGQRMGGNYGGFKHYVGFGLAFKNP